MFSLLALAKKVGFKQTGKGCRITGVHDQLKNNLAATR